LSATFNKLLKAEFDKAEHHQCERIDTQWTSKSSFTLDSAHVESNVTGQTRSRIDLSTSERIDGLIKNLNDIHTQLDEIIRRRTQQISLETESVLAHIINETHDEQQRLLTYAKERQRQQDEQYREQLQLFIAQLDETKAKDIGKLQDELQECRERILQVSHVKIKAANEQASKAKTRIVKEEQEQASIQIENINAQLHSLTTDGTFQQFGSESTCKTSFTTNAHVGNRTAEHKCSLELLQEISSEHLHADSSKSQQTVTRTIYAELPVGRQPTHEPFASSSASRIAVDART
jgi:hypothetical protein